MHKKPKKQFRALISKNYSKACNTYLQNIDNKPTPKTSPQKNLPKAKNIF